MFIISFIVGLLLGVGVLFLAEKKNRVKVDQKANNLLDKAKDRAKDILLEAKQQSIKVIDDAKEEERSRRKTLEEQETLLSQRQTKLDDRSEHLETKLTELSDKEKAVVILEDKLTDLISQESEKLSNIAKLTKDQAKQELLNLTEQEIQPELMGLVSKLKADAVEQAEDYAREIVSGAMQRIASEQTAERTVTSVSIPSDDIKGKIIGKEGRNIQSLEALSGVDILIDETPGMITISGFNPIRRQIAKVALEDLIKDGRIHPGKIEEVYRKAEKKIDKIILAAAEDACREVGVVGLPKEIMNYLGQLKFRTSYGQNVLKHSIEMSLMAVVIANEIGADVQVARTAALLHDLGKAVTHELEGKHHHLSKMLCDKYGIDPAIGHAVEAHHDDIEANTAEAMIIRAVDAISASRPGARNDSVEDFGKRMTDLENVAKKFSGIDRVYAISAGREIRIFVRPDEVDDFSALRMARDIANKIESTLKFPGTIKVNVIRETRAEEYAK
ncbi:ribonuclease Y [Candidatus Saccharibacteria bacterium]|nr:ribonuclease Y [Candidatus Saccharibacteria bacterium]